MADEGDEEMRLTDDEKRQIDELNHAGEGVLAIASYLHVPPSAVRSYLRKASKDRAGKLSGAVFLIGLALLFVPGSPLSFWPGILFVLAATSLASGLGEGNLGGGLQGAVWLAGIGLVFAFGFSLPLLFVVIGLSSLFGIFVRPKAERAEEKEERRHGLREELREAGREIRHEVFGEIRSEIGRNLDEEREKRKNDERRYREDDEDEEEDRPTEKRKRGAMRLSDDGELMDIVDDDEDEEYQDRRRR